MTVGINQPGGDGHPSDIHHLIEPLGVETLLLPDGLNQSSLDNNGICIQERIRNISGNQSADILDHQFSHMNLLKK